MSYQDNNKTYVRETRTTEPGGGGIALIVGGLVVAVGFILWLVFGGSGPGTSVVPASDTTNVTIEPPAAPADTTTNVTIDPAPEAADPAAPAEPVEPAPADDGAEPAVPATPPANP